HSHPNIPPPPIPPLFPYTTLFRSQPLEHPIDCEFHRRLSQRRWRACANKRHGGDEQTTNLRLHVLHPGIEAFIFRRDLASTTSEDRKSTRLNSSHLVISYAVFCLK